MRRIAPLATTLALGLAFAFAATAAWAQKSPANRPVKVIADARLTVKTAAGSGDIPLYVSRDWTKPQSDVTRAVIVLHGYLRNAEVYKRSAEEALDGAGDDARAHTLLVIPQFLDDVDIAAFDLPDTMLRWTHDSWEGGLDALQPPSISSFDALDAILKRLADRTLFPALRNVVVAGHSGGAQVVQRYAVLGHGDRMLAPAGVKPRYVVANPSSYAYFSAERPVFENGQWTRAFALPKAVVACPGYNVWKYGMAAPPRYAGDGTAASHEADYAARDVVYLLGAADTDPNHPALDKSCMAEAQGPYRYARGTAYVAYFSQRHPEMARQVLLEVPGVGHDGRKMFGSACGLAALFDKPGCPLP